MKFLSSALGLAIIAVLMNVLITIGMLYAERDSYLRPVLIKPTYNVPPSMWTFKPEEIDRLVAELAAERKKLDARETDLDKLVAQVAAERAELEKVRNSIQVNKDQLTSVIGEVQENEVKNIKTLAQTYSTLDPAAAVAIITEMDEAMAVKILSMMKSDKVGAIFQQMAHADGKDGSLAKRAAHLSDRLRLFKSVQKPAPQA